MTMDGPGSSDKAPKVKYERCVRHRWLNKCCEGKYNCGEKYPYNQP